MKIYLDSADATSWRLPKGCPPVHGITTNPTLVHQAHLPVTLDTYLRLIAEAADLGLAEIMLQLPQVEVSAALQWHDALRQRAQDHAIGLTIKLPCHPDWQACIEAMAAREQVFLLTGLSSPVQLLWAQAMGARWVAPYVGRLMSDGRDVWALMEACIRVQQAHGPGLLAASIKSSDVLARLMGLGAAAVTLPPNSLQAWSRDALTDAAIAQFDRDVVASRKAAAPKTSP